MNSPFACPSRPRRPSGRLGPALRGVAFAAAMGGLVAGGAGAAEPIGPGGGGLEPLGGADGAPTPLPVPRPAPPARPDDLRGDPGRPPQGLTDIGRPEPGKGDAGRSDPGKVGSTKSEGGRLTDRLQPPPAAGPAPSVPPPSVSPPKTRPSADGGSRLAVEMRTPLDLRRCDTAGAVVPISIAAMAEGTAPFPPVVPSTIGAAVIALAGVTDGARMVRVPPREGPPGDTSLTKWSFVPVVIVAGVPYALVAVEREGRITLLRPRCDALRFDASSIENRLETRTERLPLMEVAIGRGTGRVWRVPERAEIAGDLPIDDLVVVRNDAVSGWVLSQDARQNNEPRSLGELLRPLTVSPPVRSASPAARWLCRLDPSTVCTKEPVSVLIDGQRLQMVAVDEPAKTPPATPPAAPSAGARPDASAPPAAPPAASVAGPAPAAPGEGEPPPKGGEAERPADPMPGRPAEPGPMRPADPPPVKPGGGSAVGETGGARPDVAGPVPDAAAALGRPVGVRILGEAPAHARIRIHPTLAACRQAAAMRAPGGETLSSAARPVLSAEAAAVLVVGDRPISDCVVATPVERPAEAGGEAATRELVFAPVQVAGRRRAVVFSLASGLEERGLGAVFRRVVRDWAVRTVAERAHPPVVIGAIDGDRNLRPVLSAEDLTLMEGLSESERDLRIGQAIRTMRFDYRSMQALPDTRPIFDAFEDLDLEGLTYVVDGSDGVFGAHFTGAVYTWLHRRRIALTVATLGGCERWNEAFGDFPRFTCRPLGAAEDGGRFLRDVLEGTVSR